MQRRQFQTQAEEAERTMTILCESCNKPIKRTENCILRCAAATSVSRKELRIPKPFRSTKGASKARRDLINAELQTLRSLLPISEQEKERLSYLHTMALVCFHIRETQLFPPDSFNTMRPVPPLTSAAALMHPELLLSLPGFILALNGNHKLAYVSENVSHFLGFSVVELLAQGDSIFDLLSSSASKVMQEKLCFAQQHPGTEIEFITEMCTSRAFRMKYKKSRSMLMRGRFIMSETQLTLSSPALTFVAFCTPVAHAFDDEDSPSQNFAFQSKYTLDMKTAEITKNVVYHLGYQKEELIGQSWYNLLHPEDAGRAAEMHRALMHGAGKGTQSVVVRLLCKDLNWAWAQVVASKENGQAGELITCTSWILREEEAIHIKSQDLQYGIVSQPSSNQIYYYGEVQNQTQGNEGNLYPQETAKTRAGVLRFDPSQFPEVSAEKMATASFEPLFPTNLPSMVDAGSLHSSHETGCPFFPDGLSCTDQKDRQKSLSPSALYSPESSFSPDSSSSIDFSPLLERGPSSGTFSEMDTSPDQDKWAISVLAKQIHSLAEIFSQYTKERPQQPLDIALWPGLPVDHTHMAPRQSWGTDGALDFLDEFSMDEEVITSILSNLLHHDGLNQSTSVSGPEGNFHVSNPESELPLLQAPQTEATLCFDQCSFMPPFASSASAVSHVPDSQWDGTIHAELEQGIFHEEAMFC
ncbi:neuronal PAS domain-containing protein 4 [Anolis carolinensis]|uniref:Neuronal PAS domain protein 4 n=1 Tax=Anolis carolinensis TaxID=28377 RepID=G1KYN3_ANOCA|nr:PREDICTED: neuronal PAS domain-containing protein 4 [Anolis carolinensis]|eukprot:XP_008103134.1 PREDICTED: neuronal PAS domain-containing protein 4 [Anolis carolinensis]